MTCLLLAAVCLSSSQSNSEPTLRVPRRIAHETIPPAPDGARALTDAFGRPVGSWTLELEGVRANIRGRELALPRLQAWFASPDGRTLVGMGDERAPEHPFELELRVWREGEPATSFDERFDPESELVVGVDGRVALVGQRSGERGRPIARVLAADGTLARHALPVGTTAHDPILVADGLLVRVAPLAGASSTAAILRVDELGVRTWLEIPGALTLIALADREDVLVHERDALSRVDARSGRTVWRREVTLRPASEQAWASWSPSAGQSLALVTAGLLRRGERGPAPARLELFDWGTGSALASVPLEPGGPPGTLRVRDAGERLVVEDRLTKAVFAW